MSRGKSITLLSIISALVAILLVLTFVRFPVGEIKTYNSALRAIELDYDIEGGTAYTLKLAADNEEEVEDIDEVVETLEYRLNELGYSVFSVKALMSTEEGVEDYDIRIETKTTERLNSDIAAIVAYGEVEFFGGSAENPTTEILADMEVVADAQFLGMQAENNYAITIEFTQEAKDALVAAIEAEDTYYLKIVCGENANGEENVLFNTTITANAFDGNILGISGITDEESANRLVLQMKSGGLAYKYELSDPVSVTSPYGDAVATRCAIAVAALLVVIMVALILCYKGFGIIAAISTLLFMLAEIWMMIAVPNIVMSLGGVIGIVVALLLVTVGMIITCGRVKEEYAYSEKTVKAAINKGFGQSLIPVIGVNVVAGFVAICLLAFAKGALKGFAITMGIGVIISLIATLVFTRMFTALILPLVKNKEKFLNMKKAEV
ncbi:MAG: hypothetical protein IJD54_03020 [Clostridia bacterium]|nr:hypothetical protein [Clostridia bacterium]